MKPGPTITLRGEFDYSRYFQEHPTCTVPQPTVITFETDGENDRSAAIDIGDIEIRSLNQAPNGFKESYAGWRGNPGIMQLISSGATSGAVFPTENSNTRFKAGVDKWNNPHRNSGLGAFSVSLATECNELKDNRISPFHTLHLGEAIGIVVLARQEDKTAELSYIFDSKVWGQKHAVLNQGYASLATSTLVGPYFKATNNIDGITGFTATTHPNHPHSQGLLLSSFLDICQPKGIPPIHKEEYGKGKSGDRNSFFRLVDMQLEEGTPTSKVLPNAYSYVQ